MAGLQDIVPHVEVEGAEEAARQLQHLGEIGAKAFADILEASMHGDFTALSTMIGGELTGSFVKVAQSVFEFVDAAASAVETLDNLASATGMSLPALEGLKDAFASVGVSTSGFERAIGRLAMTIGNDWASIQKSVRTSADEQTRAMMDVENAAVNTQKAYRTLHDTGTKAAQEAAHDAMDVKGAQLSLERAEIAQRKASPFNYPAQDEYKEKQLKVAEADLAVERAQQALRDAAQKKVDDAITQQEKLKQHIMDVAKAKLAEREAGEKAHDSDLKDIPQIAKNLEQVAGGTKKWEEMSNHAEVSSQNLTKGIILAATKGKDAVPTVEAVYTEISLLFSKMGDSAEENAKKFEVMQHAMGAGFRAGQASAAQMVAIAERGPDALEKFRKEAEAFSKTRIGLSSGDSPIKPNDVDNLKAFNSAWAQLNAIIEQVKEHMYALVASGLTKFLVSIKEALEDETSAANGIVTAFGEFLKLIVSAGEAAGGVVKGIGEALSYIVEELSKLLGIRPDQVFLAMGVAAGVMGLAFKDVLGTIGAIMLKTAAWAVIIGLVVTAAGNLVAAWRMIKGATEEAAHNNPLENAGKAILSSASGGLSNNVPGLKEQPEDKKLAEAAQKLANAADKHSQAADKSHAAAEKANETGAKAGSAADKAQQAAEKQDQGSSKLGDAANSIMNNASWASDKLSAAATALTQAAAAISQAMGGAPGKADGGLIHGPGGPTSDTAGIFALSNGEFVMRSAAVAHYGADFMGAVNSLALGGFAVGGLVGGGAPRAPGIPLGSTKASSVLNLTIDGQHFDGLKAPDHVASKLKTFAVNRQASSAGRMPSWAG